MSKLSKVLDDKIRKDTESNILLRKSAWSADFDKAQKLREEQDYVYKRIKFFKSLSHKLKESENKTHDPKGNNE